MPDIDRLLADAKVLRTDTLKLMSTIESENLNFANAHLNDAIAHLEKHRVAFAAPEAPAEAPTPVEDALREQVAELRRELAEKADADAPDEVEDPEEALLAASEVPGGKTPPDEAPGDQGEHQSSQGPWKGDATLELGDPAAVAREQAIADQMTSGPRQTDPPEDQAG